MDKLIIEGGRALEGTLHAAGSKNAVLPILAASLLTREPLVLKGAPQLSDVHTMLGILRNLGAEGDLSADGTL
ncbi:MAG: UDP-N-acetylglucosamine 1-carboxyvinyltransferase, partial [Planctomycetota bacterium]